MNKKYILTEETLNWQGHTLHRIKALRSFNDVKKGDLGGWVESEENLSHDGICWVYDEAKVYSNAKVCDKAVIFGNAWIYGDAKVYGNAGVFDNAEVCDNARIYGNTVIYNRAKVFGNAVVYGIAWIFDNAMVCGNAKIYGNARISQTTKISQTANISKTEDYLTVGPLGSRNDFTTFFKGESGDILVNCGCFSGTIAEFKKRVEKVHGNSVYAVRYFSAMHFAESVL